MRPIDRAAALLYWPIIALAVVLAALPLVPAGVAEDSPASDFSTLRARTHLAAVAQAPRPIGTAANELARQYIATQLRNLGLEPQFQTVTVADVDLGAQATGSDPTYFTVGRARVIWYPAWWAWPVIALTGLLLALVARRRNTWASIGRGAVAAFGVAMVAAIVVALRRTVHFGCTNHLDATVALWWALALLTTAVRPEAGYLFVWPAFFGSLALALSGELLQLALVLEPRKPHPKETLH